MLQTQSPDAKDPRNILDVEQWSHRAVDREQEEKTQMQQWDHSVTHHRHMLVMSEHFLQKCSWVKQKRSCSTLLWWSLNTFCSFPSWYEHTAFIPHRQHHLSSAYQLAFNGAPKVCGTDWEQLVPSSLFPWQLRILLHSKNPQLLLLPSLPFFARGYIFPLKKQWGLIN